MEFWQINSCLVGFWMSSRQVWQKYSRDKTWKRSFAILSYRQNMTYQVNKRMTWKTHTHNNTAAGFYLCFCNPLMIRCAETELWLITISSKVSVFATISLKTNWRTPLTGLKKGEEIFHLEIVHLAHLIFLFFLSTNEILMETDCVTEATSNRIWLIALTSTAFQLGWDKIS